MTEKEKEFKYDPQKLTEVKVNELLNGVDEILKLQKKSELRYKQLQLAVIAEWMKHNPRKMYTSYYRKLFKRKEKLHAECIVLGKEVYENDNKK